MRPRVLHIGDEMSWRGGENQVRLLIENSITKVDHFVAYPAKSRGAERFSKIVPTLGFWGKKLNPISLYQTVQFCKKQNIQIIDAQGSGGHSFALLLKKFVPTLKIVVHRRVDNPITSPKKYLSPHIDSYVAISNKIGELLLQAGVAQEKIKIIRSAVDSSPYEKETPSRNELKTKLKEKLKLSIETQLLGNASAFTEQKDYETLIRAAALVVNQTNKKVHFAFAGEGPLKTKMEALSETLELKSHMSFLGHIEDVPEFLQGLDILVIPSRNEGLGTVALEGAFAGNAIIASNVGGLPEIIQHGTTGLLMPPGDFNALSQLILRLVQDKLLRNQLSTHLQVHVQKNFSVLKMAEDNVKNYFSLIS